MCVFMPAVLSCVMPYHCKQLRLFMETMGFIIRKGGSTSGDQSFVSG